MAYLLSFALDLGTPGLSLKAALFSAGVIHATFRDVTTTFYAIGSGRYEFASAAIPAAFRGVIVFYTGTLAAAADFSGVAVQSIASINPEEAENTDAKTSSIPGSAMALTSGERDSLAAVVESHLLNEGDGQMLVNAIVGAIGNTNLDQTAVVAAIRSDLERSGGKLQLIDAKTTNLPATPAAVGSAMTLTGAYDAAKTAASAAALANLQTHGDANWHTPTGFAVPSDVPSAATIATQVNTALTLSHGAGSWREGSSGGGTGLSGPSAVTLTFHDAGGNPVPLIDFTIAGQGVGRALTDGTAAFGLPDGEYVVTARPVNGVIFPNANLVVDGPKMLIITGAAAAVSVTAVIPPPASGQRSW